MAVPLNSGYLKIYDGKNYEIFSSGNFYGNYDGGMGANFQISPVKIDKGFFIDVQIQTKDGKEVYLSIPFLNRSELIDIAEMVSSSAKDFDIQLNSSISVEEKKEVNSENIYLSWEIAFSSVFGFYLLGLSLGQILKFLKKSAYDV